MENSDLEILAVGEPFKYDGEILPEGTHYNYDASGHWLHYLYNNPTKTEIQSLQSGEAEFGLFVREPVVFLLHKFGDMLWNDSSYNWWLVSENARQIPTVGDGLHALLKVVMVNTTNGIVVALRALTFSPDFTERLHQAILKQIERPWTKQEHEGVVGHVYSRYSSLDLVKRAGIFCKGGE